MALDPTATTPPDDHLKIGRLGRTFQLDGAWRLRLDEAALYEGEDGTDPVGVRALLAGARVFVRRLGSVRVRELTSGNNGLLLKVEGVRDRNTAQALVNEDLYVDLTSLPEELAEELVAELEAGTDEERLVGFPVLLNGALVGGVSGANFSTANPLIEVQLTGGGRHLLPLSAPYVELTEDQLLVTNPPAGLLGTD